ncbi:hypothetical protein Ddc_16955 [Ditylenchus destructor]|nr:hypothetical protein Ddc_16955 [Ditylenchus destructor]
MPMVICKSIRTAVISALALLLCCSSSLVVVSAASSAQCDVFDPFKVQPDNNNYQIGGAFPLHKEDCLELIPSTVQEIVAVQWALSHWNQNPQNEGRAKLGFFAGDSCSRPKEAVSQSLRFLDSVGYHEPLECQRKAKQVKADDEKRIPQLIGVLSPKDSLSASALASVLKPTQVPTAVYTTASLHQFMEQGVSNVISAAPAVDTYFQASVKLFEI